MLSTKPVDIAIQKIDDHPSIKLIGNNSTLSDMSEFGSVFLDGILKEIKTLNSVKNVTFKNIPTHCLKEIVDISSPILNQIWNNKIIN